MSAGRSLDEPTAEHLAYWQHEADEAERRVIVSQIERHYSLYILKWSAGEDLIEELALWAYQVESVASGRLMALHAAVSIIAEQDKTITQLRRQIAERRAADRQASARRPRVSRQVAA